MKSRVFYIFCLLLCLTGCGVASVSLHSERVVWSSSDTRPEWLAHSPDDTPQLYFAVGMAEGEQESGTTTDARENAARQVAERMYGAKISKRYQSLRTNLGTKVVDWMSSETAGKVVGFRTEAVYAEKVKVRVTAQKVAYRYKVWIKASFERARLDEVVNSWMKSIEFERLQWQQDGRLLIALGCTSKPVGACKSSIRSHIEQAVTAAGMIPSAFVKLPAQTRLQTRSEVDRLAKAHRAARILQVTIEGQVIGTADGIVYATARPDARLWDTLSGKVVMTWRAPDDEHPFKDGAPLKQGNQPAVQAVWSSILASLTDEYDGLKQGVAGWRNELRLNNLSATHRGTHPRQESLKP